MPPLFAPEYTLPDTIENRELKDYTETSETISAGTETKDLDIDNGNVKRVNLTGNPTFTISGDSLVAGKSVSLTLVLVQDATGSRTVTWPASVKWASGTAPTLTTTASRADVITLFTIDGGTNWLGFVAGQNYTLS